MAVTHAEEFNGHYIGSLSKDRAEMVLKVTAEKSIPNLTRMLCSFPSEMVNQAIDEHISLRDVINNGQYDKSQFFGELRPEQTVGTAFMYYSPRSILGDGVGLGKTIEVAGLLNILESKGELTRALIAVENDAPEQIQRELIRFTGLKIERITKTGEALTKELASFNWGNTKVVVISHSKIIQNNFLQFLSRNLNDDGTSSVFNTFILDESSVVKNNNTNIHRTVKELCKIVPRVHFLNATTFERSIKDIYNQLDLIDESLLPKWWRIEKEFCIMQRNSFWVTVGGRPTQKFRRDIIGYRSQDVFRDRIRLVYFGRSVDKMDLGNEYKVLLLQPTDAQRSCIKQGYRSNEVLNCPSMIPEIGIPMTTEGIPKLKQLEILMRERPNKNIFIYCFHTQAQGAIKSIAEGLGRKAIIINGSVSQKERQGLIDQFNTGEVNTIISNIKRSINLYAGDTCIYYSVEGNPSRMEQIRGRIDRHVDDSLKEFLLMVYKGTDEYRWLVDLAQSRSKASSDLTVKTQSAVDKFIDAMIRDHQLEDKGGKSNAKQENSHMYSDTTISGRFISMR